jgi:hypothetical protein
LSHQRVVRRGLLACTMLFVLCLAWQALSGGFRQIPRSRTVGQKAETMTQIECGLLSLLAVLTCFRWRWWAAPVRTLWGISLASAAGLSALVWGPPMPHIGVLFIAISLLLARGVIWTLRLF